jgi:AmmeMemoRadiSam system protein B
MNIKFACISPHPPILLPSVGLNKEKKKVQKTISSLGKLEKKFNQLKIDEIIISSPHPDWGFNVPLHFIANKFHGKIKTLLIGTESPSFYFKQGGKMVSEMEDKNYAIISSGDLSHYLKKEGPYGFNPQGPKFDKEFIRYLKEKDVLNIIKLDKKFPEAGECGLRSFCFLLGILDNYKSDWQPEILSYQDSFGVGYLVANFKIK